MEYEIQLLDEQFELSEMGLEPLEEAGGLMSWLKRAFTGVDGTLAGEIRETLSNIKTERDRVHLLDELNEFISEAENAERDGFFGDVLWALGFGALGGVAGSIGGATRGAVVASKMIPPSIVTNKVTSFLARVKVPGISNYVAAKKNMAAAAFKAQQFGAVVNSTLYGLAIGAVSAALIAIIFRSVNRHSGNTKMYIDALKAVRDEVRIMKIPKMKE